MSNHLRTYASTSGLVLIAVAAALAGSGAVISALAVLLGGALVVASGWTIVHHASSIQRR